MASVHRRGDRWQGRYRDASGCQRSGGVFDLKRDANRVKTEIERRAQMGTLADLDAGRRSFAEAADHYEEHHVLVNTSVSHQRQVRQQRRHHIDPALGGLQLREVRPGVLDQFYAQLRRRGVGEPTLAKIHVIVSGVLAHAVTLEWIEANPAQEVRKPRQAPGDPFEPLEPIEVERTVAHMADPADRWPPR